MRRISTANAYVCTHLAWSSVLSGQNHLDEKSGMSAFRPCGRDLVEFFNCTGWAFPRPGGLLPSN